MNHHARSFSFIVHHGINGKYIKLFISRKNVNVRVEQDVKVQAEAILEQLGISVSTFINMTYRQVIMIFELKSEFGFIGNVLHFAAHAIELN